MFPRLFEPFLFALVLSCLMSLLVSGITTLRTLGLMDGFMASWVSNWLSSWLVAYPSVLVVAPIAKRAVGRVIQQPV